MYAVKSHHLLDIGAASWYVDPVPCLHISVLDGELPDDPALLTPVVLLDSAQYQEDNVQSLSKVMHSIEHDHAYHKAFASCILVNQRGRDARLKPTHLDYLRRQPSKVLSIVVTSDISGTSSHNTDQGIYCMLGTSLHRVFRLFHDPCGAFVCGILHPPADHTLHNFTHSHIPVPFRSSSLFDSPASANPLRGMTIAVKDVIDIAGLPTTVCSKEYASFRGNARKNAPIIDILISSGATIVGKTKTAQFASGEHAADWVDFQCPVNPRGDGSFEPYCSSTGSAAAVAAYPWLDAAIGSDTLGSIIQPAAGYGIFGLRPTHGTHGPALDLSRSLKVSSPLDTIGPFARSLSVLRALTECLYGTHEERSKSFQLGEPGHVPFRILYPASDFDGYPPLKRKLLDGFVHHILETGPAQSFKYSFDIDNSWRQWHVSHHSSVSIDQYLQTTLAHMQLYDSYNNNLPFRTDFVKARGHEPLVNPLVKYKWELGSHITNKQYLEACEQQTVFQHFLLDAVFNDFSILVLPASPTELVYRDKNHLSFDERAPALQGYGFNLHQCAFLGGLPELVVPVGQVPVISKTTNKKTFEPVCLALIGPPGSEHHLINVAEAAFKTRGYDLFGVQTGETAFPVKSS